jgi:hypothetical protein
VEDPGQDELCFNWGSLMTRLANARDLSYVRHRLALAFRARKVLARFGLQYRLTETSPLKFEARTLSLAIGRLLSTSGGPVEIEPGLYGENDIDPEELKSLRDAGVSALQDLAAGDHEAAFQRVPKILAKTLGLRAAARTITIEPEQPEALIQDALLPQYSAHLAPNNGGKRVLCWVSHELQPIYADDTRLWRLLARAVEEEARPLILARRVSDRTFELLKALGGFALYYSGPAFTSPHTTGPARTTRSNRLAADAWGPRNLGPPRLAPSPKVRRAADDAPRPSP